MLNPGATIQNYKVISLIGEGGMGAVYKCGDQVLGRMVAIKELNTIFTADDSFIQRFRQEAQLQAKLVHPGIVSLHTFFEESGQYYMVMEYAEGSTIKDLIRKVGPIPEKRAISILKQILQALAYAHGKNIIHRDIKPANIIINSDDEIKILDFGIARIMGEKGLTQTGQQLGTVTYMSPEQVRALKDIDGRSDIFSTGVTFFEMLSGRLPYDTATDSDYDIMNQIVQSALPDPRSYYPHISEHSINILNKMLERDRDKRFVSANQVLQALEHGTVQETNQEQRKAREIPKSQFGQAGQHQAQPRVELTQTIPTYLTQAILVTFFCCLPFGIPAIHNASKVANSIALNNYTEAREYSLKAKKWINWAFWSGLVIGFISFFSSFLSAGTVF